MHFSGYQQVWTTLQVLALKPGFVFAFCHFVSMWPWTKYFLTYKMNTSTAHRQVTGITRYHRFTWDILSPDLESAIFPRSCASFYQNMVFREQIWTLGELIVLSASKTFGEQSWKISIFLRENTSYIYIDCFNSNLKLRIFTISWTLYLYPFFLKVLVPNNISIIT